MRGSGPQGGKPRARPGLQVLPVATRCVSLGSAGGRRSPAPDSAARAGAGYPPGATRAVCTEPPGTDFLKKKPGAVTFPPRLLSAPFWVLGCPEPTPALWLRVPQITTARLSVSPPGGSRSRAGTLTQSPPPQTHSRPSRTFCGASAVPCEQPERRTTYLCLLLGRRRRRTPGPKQTPGTRAASRDGQQRRAASAGFSSAPAETKR